MASRDDFFSRFTDPVLDDPALPLTDVSVAQIVAPALQVFWYIGSGSPRPSWLQPILFTQLFDTRGSLVAPTLIHGAELACCWLLGALAARSYEARNIDPTIEGYGTVVWSVLKAGMFATGLLILGTQTDLYYEFGKYVQYGDSPVTDLRIVQATTELVNDVVFEATLLLSVRLFLAVSIERGKQ